MGKMHGQNGRSPRCIALVGPYLSGKTSLLEAILARSGAISRQGRVSAGNSVGDASQEARDHGMSVELNVADAEFLGDSFTFLDCPGSLEFQFDALASLSGCDAAIVVCEPDEKKVPALQLILKQLDDRKIPHFLFLNKIDKYDGRVRDLLSVMQPASKVPLVLRQIPIWEDGIATGFVDLASERAFVYREHKTSEIVEMPNAIGERRGEARFSMLEQLADYDDLLMEQLLEDMEPPRDQIFGDLSKELREGLICPVFFGSAENGNGVFRLLKALRHEAPFVEETAARLGVDGTTACAQILKTYHTEHAGKLSVARILSGAFGDGDTLYGRSGETRISGVFSLMGQEPTKRGTARLGDTVAFGRLDNADTGDTLSLAKDDVVQIDTIDVPPPVFAKSIFVSERKDEVKLTAALSKIIQEDPSIVVEHDQELGEMVLHGQGEMHLRVVLERLGRKFGVAASADVPHVPYKETIRKSVEVRGRYKKQSGGHGQFGDVLVTIKPRQRGSGFAFSDTITGGVVPKQYIPSVEAGVRDYLVRGPLGFPVVDVEVCLTDGSYHSVDSSDQAFRTAGRIAMAEGMPDCSPVLLEPVLAVEIAIPSDATAKINAIISSRRGQILGFDSREGWDGWDVVQAHMPQSEIQDLIVEIRSATSGVGTFTYQFDHLAELTGKAADHVLRGHAAQAA